MTMHLQRDLERLRKDILHLGSMVKDTTQKSIDYLDSRKAHLVGEVREMEATINDLEVDIEEDCLKILALHQPVAIDLRFIVVVMKVNNDLERMGDQALNIVHRVQSLEGEPKLGADLPVDEMTEVIKEMVSMSLDALVNQDPELAKRVVEMDDIVDDLHAKTYEVLRSRVLDDPARVSAAMSFATISSNLERIGDLCTNIGEEVVFMVEGQVVRHLD